MERVAVIMGKMHSGGKKNLVMEYYRNIDKSKIQHLCTEPYLISSFGRNRVEKDKIKPRSNSIDVLKGIAALLVCYQHAYGTYGISDYILAISRIAVPLFVMITGFFYYSSMAGATRKHIKKLTIS